MNAFNVANTHETARAPFAGKARENEFLGQEGGSAKKLISETVEHLWGNLRPVDAKLRYIIEGKAKLGLLLEQVHKNGGDSELERTCASIKALSPEPDSTWNAAARIFEFPALLEKAYGVQKGASIFSSIVNSLSASDIGTAGSCAIAASGFNDLFFAANSGAIRENFASAMGFLKDAWKGAGKEDAMRYKGELIRSVSEYIRLDNARCFDCAVDKESFAQAFEEFWQRPGVEIGEKLGMDLEAFPEAVLAAWGALEKPGGKVKVGNCTIENMVGLRGAPMLLFSSPEYAGDFGELMATLGDSRFEGAFTLMEDRHPSAINAFVAVAAYIGREDAFRLASIVASDNVKERWGTDNNVMIFGQSNSLLDICDAIIGSAKKGDLEGAIKSIGDLEALMKSGEPFIR